MAKKFCYIFSFIIISLFHSTQSGIAGTTLVMGRAAHTLAENNQENITVNNTVNNQAMLKNPQKTIIAEPPTIRTIHPAKRPIREIIFTKKPTQIIKHAQSPHYGTPLNKKLSYYVLQQTVGMAIKDIATQLNLPVVIAPNVKGKVAAGKYKGTAREILDLMVADSNLHWFYDGRAIQVTSVQDAIMHIVQLNNYSLTNLEQALKQINFDTSAFPIRYDAVNNMAIVYGPPKYVATIEVVANHLANRSRQKPDVIRG